MSSIEAMNGIMASSDYIDIISNNIANASTIGFKSSTPSFFDVVSDSFYSKKTLHSGVGISNVTQNFNHGILMDTGRDLDLGIEKDGFFRILDNEGHVHYTRNGQFLLDKNKNIVNTQGMYLTGQNQIDLKDELNNISNLEPINLKKSDSLKAKSTNKITIYANLTDNIHSNEQTVNIENDELNTSVVGSSYITIYDKNSNPYKVSISFKKINSSEWNMNIESNKINSNIKKEIIKKDFKLKFDSYGKLISDVSDLSFELENFDKIHINLNCVIKKSDIDRSLIRLSQNGYLEGSLKNFDILNNGEIIGQYTNQQERKIGQIFLSKFINPEKLKPESGGTWSTTTESGPENIGIAGDSSFGVLMPKSLEASNVDLNKELINMIIAQRNYQSNAQAFKTEDRLINTLIDLR